MNNFPLQEKEYLPLFKVLSPHGLKGDLKVALLSFNEEVVKTIKYLYLKNQWGNPLEIDEIKKGPGFKTFLVKIKNLDYEKAKAFANKILYVRSEELPKLSEEEFYYYELEGFTARDEKGKVWGRVVEVMPVGEYELILVKSEEGKEFYIPLVEEYIERIDKEKGIIIVKDIDALFESQL